VRREAKAMARLRDGLDYRGTHDAARAVASHPASPPQDAAGARCAATGRGQPDPDGVVLADTAIVGEETEPAATTAEVAAAEEKRLRISPRPDSSRPLRRRSARQAKAAEMEAAASNHRQELASLEPKPRGTTPTTFSSPTTRSSPPPPRARTPMTMRTTRRTLSSSSD
jgi:hypothetical protein